MGFNKKKNIVAVIASLFLFAALIEGWPYGFFTLLRFVVFAATAYLAWLSYETKKEKWIWIYGFIAVIFNPFIPLYFGRDLWIIIDLLVAVFLIVSIFIFKLTAKIEK